METHFLYSVSGFDSFAAAYSAWKRWGQWATYSELLFNQSRKVCPKDFVTRLDVDGQRVYSLGVQFLTSDILDELHSRCDFTVLAHSSNRVQSNAVALETDKSVCSLAWETWCQDIPEPLMFEYIRTSEYGSTDEHTRLVLRNLYSYGYRFQAWDQALPKLESNRQHFADEGKAIERIFRCQVELLAKQRRISSFGELNLCSINAPTIYAQGLFSRLASSYDIVVVYQIAAGSNALVYIHGQLENLNMLIAHFGSAFIHYGPNNGFVPRDALFKLIYG